MPLHLIHPVHRATHRIGLYLDQLRENGLGHIADYLIEANGADAYMDDLDELPDYPEEKKNLESPEEKHRSNDAYDDRIEG